MDAPLFLFHDQRYKEIQMGYPELATAVVAEAIKDTFDASANQKVRDDAIEFLKSDHCKKLCLFLGLDYEGEHGNQ